MTPKLKLDEPEMLRPYLFHGLVLDWSSGRDELVTDCPFCGKPHHFTVNQRTGLWRCLVCGQGSDRGGGNIHIFLRLLWETSDRATQDYRQLADERGLLNPDTLVYWGLCCSVLTNEWLIPAYNAKGSLCQLCRYVDGRTLATPGLSHGLFGRHLYVPEREYIYLCEGQWDGMLLWEALRTASEVKGSNKLAVTADLEACLAVDANVLAVPGCSTFNTAWAPLFAGKVVYLVYDNDYPQIHPKTGKTSAPAGLAGMRRVARLLSAGVVPPAGVSYVRWGAEGWNAERTDGYREGWSHGHPAGYDVSDHLRGASGRENFDASDRYMGDKG